VSVEILQLFHAYGAGVSLCVSLEAQDLIRWLVAPCANEFTALEEVQGHHGIVISMLKRYYHQNTYAEDYWKVEMLFYNHPKD
jgi:hypothetical protein